MEVSKDDDFNELDEISSLARNDVIPTKMKDENKAIEISDKMG